MKRSPPTRYAAAPGPSPYLSESSPVAYGLPLSEVRERLSPLVRQIGASGELAIKVRGQVQAYLVSRERFEALVAKAEPALPRPKIAGSIRIVGDLDEASREAGRELERYALASLDAELKRG
ncbi:MAG TPA: hypothetical protein VEY30_06255 [Myxococcaceae bacterium]|nr:hypothetical protein [Myxococcaceae bacterium]